MIVLLEHINLTKIVLLVHHVLIHVKHAHKNQITVLNVNQELVIYTQKRMQLEHVSIMELSPKYVLKVNFPPKLRMETNVQLLVVIVLTDIIQTRLQENVKNVVVLAINV